jgi:methylthioxylose transferase
METSALAGARPAHPGSTVTARSWAPALVALASWTLLVVVANRWGTALNDAGQGILLNAPPLFGEPDIRLDPRLAIAAGVAGAMIAGAPSAARRLGWRPLLMAAALAAIAWPVALALAEGTAGITAPLEGPSDYLVDVSAIASPGEFLSTFTERIDDYATHVRSHPPGMVLALWALDAIGLAGPGPAAVLMLAVAASAAPAALIAMRAVAGETGARRAAPYLVLAPAAVWIATTADAFYMGVGAWAVAALVCALTSEGRRSHLLGVVGGLAFGLCLFLSYGLALLGAIPLAVAVARRRWAPLGLAAVAALAVVGAFAAAGFWWADGFAASREQYLASIARTRPYDFFLAGNVAAFALALGPAAAVALAALRDRSTWLLVGGALAAVAVADLSGMSKGEVERIWLPFVPWVLLATAALPVARWPRALLLGAQAACGIVIQASVEMIW